MDIHSRSTACEEVPVAPAAGGEPRGRLRLVIHGVVQGVGFRPFLARLARDLALAGWVSNTPQGVLAEFEGEPANLRQLLLRIGPERPRHSSLQSLESTWLEPLGAVGFAIRPSTQAGENTALVLPDIATCPECLREVFDPHDRRAGYPFTNCTHCGPRFSIVQALPYDRGNTTMREFAMCERCRAEYEDPDNRRFHAQPNACPDCGPRLELWDRAGRVLDQRREALLEAAHALREGAIVALKGLGGFQLLALAADDATVQRLRRAKHREEKPFALMFPTLAAVAAHCAVGELEARLLQSPESPIVLLRRRRDAAAALSPLIAPGNPCFGAMLPYTPLHHLLLANLGQPVVATSGNLADEPICIDEREALGRLGPIADVFLVHNRPIARHVDDSIVRVVLGREMVLRRARGYAPLPVTVAEELPSVLAVGAHLKNTVAVSRGRQVFLSQHIGDLETPAALTAFERVAQDLPRLFGVTPEAVAADAHPDYLSTKHARASGKRVVCVQHHYAHVLACMAENDVPAPLLGVSWDGTGYGPDETIWGGEFLLLTEEACERVGHLRAFRLPGGEKAVQEPRRSALGLLHALLGAAAFECRDTATLQSFKPAELRILRRMLEGGVNSPVTTSIGRLFDAIASLSGLRQQTHFEGQAAMDLEFALENDDSDEAYPLTVVPVRSSAQSVDGAVSACPLHRECCLLKTGPPRFTADWAPLVRAVLTDLRAGVRAWEISARFHNALVECVVSVARNVGQRRVVLSGGCFQNRYLIERTVRRLHEEGFSAFWHQRVPPNDGGIALGQVIGAARSLKAGKR